MTIVEVLLQVSFQEKIEGKNGVVEGSLVKTGELKNVGKLQTSF